MFRTDPMFVPWVAIVRRITWKVSFGMRAIVGIGDGLFDLAAKGMAKWGF